MQELTRATSDLKNFLESTQIATIFLDNEMRVMNFTPAITQILHMVETDIGRPIGHIKARIRSRSSTTRCGGCCGRSPAPSAS